MQHSQQHQQSAEDGIAGTTAEDPPDPRIGGAADYGKSQAVAVNHNESVAPPSTAPASPIEYRRASTDSRLSPLVSYSPSMSGHGGDGHAGSVSDNEHEHELDSPSSLSSWNSWAGGRRGDLADVEDLELDGGHEPELETVSELDEESSSFCSGSDRLNGLDSDDDVRSSAPGTSSQHRSSTGSSSPSSVTNPSGVGDHSPRRKHYRFSERLSDHLSNLSLQNHHHSNHQNAYTMQSTSHPQPHGVPSYPHFSPRAGGHGLSHHSRYSLRAPPNLAARRKKGRLSELAEEGGADGISTTKMPVPDPNAGEQNKDAENSESGSHNESQVSAATSQQGGSQVFDLSTGSGAFDGGPTTPTPNSWTNFEVFGPPPPPMRCVSPSETVPVVPSPLCECVTAPEDDVGMAVDATPACETPREERSLTPTKLHNEGSTVFRVSDGDATIDAHANGSASPPSPTASRISVETGANGSTPPTSPPSSPRISRTSSRNRRTSSPTTRAKGKFPLRPCFKRGTSTQSSLNMSSRDSSLERSGGRDSRGRTKVRFSPAPPVEVRTHSPVEYDRKPCPINNRLSTGDLEELRDMKMEMGLLEAKCAALAACKFDDPALATEESESETEQAVARWSARTAGPNQGQARLQELTAAPTSPNVAERKRADSISSSSPTTFCHGRFAKRDHPAPPSPADYLRMERERERERVCRMAGIGTGAGFRYTGGGDGNPNTRQMPHGGCEALGASIVSRWGLSKPPPPLPGVSASAPGSPASQTFDPSSQVRSTYLDHGPPLSPTTATTGLLRPKSAPPPQSSKLAGLNVDSMDHDGDLVLSGSLTINEQEMPGSSLIATESHDELYEEPRGRATTKDATARRTTHNDSASTDATVTPVTSSGSSMRKESKTNGRTVPSLVRTAPSPTSSPERPYSRSRSPTDERLRKLPLEQQRQHPQPQSYRQPPLATWCSKPSASKGIDGMAPLPSSSSSIASMPSAASFGGSSCGYDSPASEFYESGSEYDLLG